MKSQTFGSSDLRIQTQKSELTESGDSIKEDVITPTLSLDAFSDIVRNEREKSTRNKSLKKLHFLNGNSPDQINGNSSSEEGINQKSKSSDPVELADVSFNLNNSKLEKDNIGFGQFIERAQNVPKQTTKE